MKELIFVHEPKDALSKHLKVIVETMSLLKYPFKIETTDTFKARFTKDHPSFNIESPAIVYLNIETEGDYKDSRILSKHLLANALAMLSLAPHLLNASDFSDLVVQLVQAITQPSQLPHKDNDKKAKKARETKTQYVK